LTVEKRERITWKSKKFGKIINEFDFLAAPSNRRLESQSLGKRVNLRWSIDRITIVGEIKYFQVTNSDGEIICGFDDVFTKLCEKGHAEEAGNGWVIKDKYNENIAYCEILKYDDNKARIDFNPNRLGNFLEDDLKAFFKKLLINPHFSRADVACDLINIPDELISQYTIVAPVKSVLYHDKVGKLETAYWGSRSSERQVRLYNKYVEQSRKGQIIQEEIKTWWRLEMQLRRDKASNWINIVRETLSEFKSPLFFPVDMKVTDKIMLTGLLSDESLWAELSKNSRTKYKKLLNELTQDDELTLALVESFSDCYLDLKNELDTWLIGLDVTSDDV
jgi:hypothetical protein